MYLYGLLSLKLKEQHTYLPRYLMYRRSCIYHVQRITIGALPRAFKEALST